MERLTTLSNHTLHFLPQIKIFRECGKQFSRKLALFSLPTRKLNLNLQHANYVLLLQWDKTWSGVLFYKTSRGSSTQFCRQICAFPPPQDQHLHSVSSDQAGFDLNMTFSQETVISHKYLLLSGCSYCQRPNTEWINVPGNILKQIF